EILLAHGFELCAGALHAPTLSRRARRRGTRGHAPLASLGPSLYSTMAVSVRLLGTPSIRWGGVDHEPAATRASALAHFLAFQGRWVARDELLALFWPDVDESRARTSLRQVLTTLRRMPFCGGVEVDGPRVRRLAETAPAVVRASLAG